MPMQVLVPRPRRRAAWAASWAVALCVPLGACAAVGAKPVENSSLDAPLFYQLLIGEIELRQGQAGNAYQVVLDAARRTRDEQLFRRAVEIALQARAGEEALGATRAWRGARPESLDAMRYQIQLLGALNRPADAAEPIRALIERTGLAERAGLIATLPRAFQRVPDRRAVAALFDQVLAGYRDAPVTRTASLVTLGRVLLQAGEPARALQYARDARAYDAQAPGPALLALDMLPGHADAERLVVDYLETPKAELAVRLAYAQALTNAQRYADAVQQLEIVARQQPDNAAPWLTLGALHLELHETKAAETALERYLQLVQGTAEPADGAASAPSREDGMTQAWLLLAQAAEQRGDVKAAETWLARVDNPQRALEVQSRRAALLARQGQLAEARELIRRAPERQPEDARAKLMVEAQLLREAKLWREARGVLAGAVERFKDDADLVYELAMVDEKLDRLDDMERLLRQVIALKPDHQHAYNALGYSLADRNLRLPEARALIVKALELAPGDPFITDSLGWVEFRMGNAAEALRLLREAYRVRPDVEIAAHLGEVLWAMGEQDEARRVLAAARNRDAGNEVLKETLARLKVDL